MISYQHQYMWLPLQHDVFRVRVFNMNVRTYVQACVHVNRFTLLVDT